MEKVNNIVWIASFPKSGNTWMRCFLSYFTPKKAFSYIDINNLKFNLNGYSQTLFKKETLLDATDFSKEEVDILRPTVYQSYALGKWIKFMKIHDSFRYNAKGNCIYDGAGIKGAIYLVRNPIDIVISMENHFVSRNSRKDAIASLNEGYEYSSNQIRRGEILNGRVENWSAHVSSWDSAPINKIIIRYENMKTNPQVTFKKVLDFCGIPYSNATLNDALEKSRIEALQLQEQESSFKEKGVKQKLFFRKGQIGEGKQKLNLQEKKAIIQKHRTVMEKYGYDTKII